MCDGDMITWRRGRLTATVEDASETAGLFSVDDIALGRGCSHGAEVATTPSAELNSHTQQGEDNKGCQERVLLPGHTVNAVVDGGLGVDKRISLVDESCVGKHINTGHDRVGADEGGSDNDHLAFTDKAEDETHNGQDSEQDGASSRGRDQSSGLPAQDPETERVKGQSAKDGDSQSRTADQEQTSQDTDDDRNDKQQGLGGHTTVGHADIGDVAKEVEANQEHGDMEETVTKEAEQETGDDQDRSCDSSLDRYLVRSCRCWVGDLLAGDVDGSGHCGHEVDEHGKDHEEVDGCAPHAGASRGYY